MGDKTVRPSKPPGGPMWWQRNPPEGWHFVKNVERATLMDRELTPDQCDYVLNTPFGPQPSRFGWTGIHGWKDEPSRLVLTGGGWGRPRNARGQSIANNDDAYTMRVERPG